MKETMIMGLNMSKTGHKHKPSDIRYIDKDMVNNKSGVSSDICMACGEIIQVYPNGK